MTIAFRSQANNGIGSTPGNNLVVTKPSGTVDDDLMIAIAFWHTTTASTTWPSGWTQLFQVAGGGTDRKYGAAYKKAASEGSNYTFSWTGDDVSCRVGIASYSGVDTTTAIDIQGTGQEQATTSPVSLGVTTNYDNSMLLSIHLGRWSQASFTSPTGMTERIDSNNAENCGCGAISLHELLLGSAGATGNKTATCTDETDIYSIQIALKEATAGGTVIPIFMNQYRQRWK